MFRDQTIFFSALDWGLGHATRSLPLLKELVRSNQVILGVSPSQKTFYNTHFPDLEKVPMPSYNVTYSRFFPAWFKVLTQSPFIFFTVKKERSIVQKLLVSRKITVLLSENRYGLYSKKCTSIIITHQLNIDAPFFSSLANRINQRLLSRFNEIWVPDHASELNCLAGKLSRNTGNLPAVKYIGPLSALKEFKKEQTIRYDFLFLLSGPEPLRTELEELLMKACEKSVTKIVIVRGSLKPRKKYPQHIEVYDLLQGEMLTRLIENAETIVCRSGYSTLMDLHVLNKKIIILVPTPGQTEQEYLAQYWEKKFNAVKLNQSQIITY